MKNKVIDIKELDEEFYNISKDILHNSLFLSQREIKHHTNSILDHVITVAYISYKIAKKLKLDYYSICRGALLHDFFLYDWRMSNNRHIKYFKNMHGVNHPNIAIKNAKRNFYLNEKEKDIIIKHMFPATIIPPKYLESYIVCLIDKYCAINEYFFVNYVFEF